VAHLSAPDDAGTDFNLGPGYPPGVCEKLQRLLARRVTAHEESRWALRGRKRDAARRLFQTAAPPQPRKSCALIGEMQIAGQKNFWTPARQVDKRPVAHPACNCVPNQMLDACQAAIRLSMETLLRYDDARQDRAGGVAKLVAGMLG
jgi:hypothetical protein